MPKRTLLAAAAVLILCAPAWANGFESESDSGWRAQVTAYGWASSMSGKVRPTGMVPLGLTSPPTFHVDKPFSDILKNLDGGFFLHGTLRRDRFVFLGDFLWASVSEKHHSSLFGGALPVSARTRVNQLSATLLAGHSLVDGPGFTFDVLGGARVWRIKASGSATAGPFTGSLSHTESWVDPIVAARMRVDLAPDWSVILYGDYGGFGVGSKSTWQLIGTLNYRVRENMYLSLGYRHLSFDYREGGRFLDLDMSGPILGATWRF